MKLSIELASRFFYVETGAIEPIEIVEIDEAEADEATEVIRLPMGFLPPPPDEEGYEDDEEFQEADCG